MDDGGADHAVMRRAEIDTRAPFRSVKEAILLFGERVLAGEVYSTKLKEEGNGYDGYGENKLGTVTAELEETKQSLEREREESLLMATCLSSLQDELERTKLELRQLKEKELEKPAMEREIDIEDLKFHVEDDDKAAFNGKPGRAATCSNELQKKRYVSFANPPISLAKVVVPQPQGDAELERNPSLRQQQQKKEKEKKMKKPLMIPLMVGAIFSRKKRSSDVAPPQA
ncbi:WEB family protein At1g75720 isoform X2 [Diospyros lotus]|uniref:WEB family protein At1g75720 isoform X2 n=1 Tax=Diospyros lotus TaxID=55363 RepID=UPI002254D70B|nr:WEB family protein At1g75720 isoform X2 [Diospyros lotus]